MMYVDLLFLIEVSNQVIAAYLSELMSIAYILSVITNVNVYKAVVSVCHGH
jgi:hypothetical protein